MTIEGFVEICFSLGEDLHDYIEIRENDDDDPYELVLRLTPRQAVRLLDKLDYSYKTEDPGGDPKERWTE